MNARKSSEARLSDQTIIILGSFILFVGLIIVITSLILSTTGSGGVRAKSGAVVLIGPIPIIFGSDRRTASQLVILVIILALVLIALYLLQIL